MLKEGLTYTSKLLVSSNHTARILGSGDLEVVGTPALVALMENAAMLAVAPYLPEEDTTVGGQIELSHLKPTRIGKEIDATATLVKIDRKKLFFEIVAHEDNEIIGKANHIRFIVNREKFMNFQ